MAQSAWANSISKIDTLNMEFICHHNSGEEFWIYWQSVPEFNKNGVHTGFVESCIDNATKFSPEGEAVSVSLALNEGRVRIVIQNKGAGIPKSFHSKLFLAFTQADGSDRRVKGGTGLELGIAKSIAERHSGHIHYDTVQHK